MNWGELFVYLADGSLINKIDRNSRSRAGRVAGMINDSGYRVTRVNGKNYRVHRIIWEMHHGEIPCGLEIDHINRDRLDNRIENLRLATRHEQNLNMSKRKSTSGITGVCWSKKDKRWQALIGFKGKSYYLGQFIEKRDAIKARRDAEIKFNFRNIQ